MSSRATTPSLPRMAEQESRPFADLRPTGLLWLINVTVFHPRGYALALHFEDAEHQVCTGWSLMGDGSESWSMRDPEMTPELEAIIAVDPVAGMTNDDLFRAAAALLKPKLDMPESVS